MIRISALLMLALLALPALQSPAQARPVVEVAFVLDTTGSMGGLLEGAKRKIWSIATSIVDANPAADIRMALVAYRDIGDEYVTKKFDLTTDIQDLYANLLELKARGGGDWPESVNEALHVAVDKLAWSAGAEHCRIVFLVGDAPPHMDYAQDMKYPQVAALAKQKDIVINAVQAGGARDTERVWREIAQLGSGRYIPIPQDGGKIVVIETPYDVEIIELQERLNGTVIPYGPRSRQSRVEEKTRQIAAVPLTAGSEMASYLNKRMRTASAAEAVTGDGDLVADVAAGRQKLGSVAEAELPDTMRKLTPAQREAELNRRMSERKALVERMAELVRKRDRHVEEQRGKAPARTADSFDRAVEETLRTQVRR
jgi:hypothetical protein